MAGAFHSITISIEVFADNLTNQRGVADIVLCGQLLQPLKVSYFKWDRD
jgi:hypothetical protein